MTETTARDFAIERWGEDPQRWPAWDCRCGQRHSGWALDCGRCGAQRFDLPWDPITALEHKIEASMAAAVADINARIVTVHQRVACPECMAPKGEPCHAMPKGWVVGPRGGGCGRVLKNPHRERLHADGIYER